MSEPRATSEITEVMQVMQRIEAALQVLVDNNAGQPHPSRPSCSLAVATDESVQQKKTSRSNDNIDTFAVNADVKQMILAIVRGEKKEHAAGRRLWTTTTTTTTTEAEPSRSGIRSLKPETCPYYLKRQKDTGVNQESVLTLKSLIEEGKVNEEWPGYLNKMVKNKLLLQRKLDLLQQ